MNRARQEAKTAEVGIYLVHGWKIGSHWCVSLHPYGNLKGRTLLFSDEAIQDAHVDFMESGSPHVRVTTTKALLTDPERNAVRTAVDSWNLS